VVWSASPLLREGLVGWETDDVVGLVWSEREGSVGVQGLRKKMKMESMGDGLYAGTKRGTVGSWWL